MDSINNACKLGSDAWLELQAFKTRQLNRREKLNRHKNLQNGLTAGGQLGPAAAPGSAAVGSTAAATSAPGYPSPPTSSTAVGSSDHQSATDDDHHHKLRTSSGSQDLAASAAFNNADPDAHPIGQDPQPGPLAASGLDRQQDSSITATTTNATSSPPSRQAAAEQQQPPRVELVECLLLLKLCDVALKLPIDSKSLQRTISKVRNLENTPRSLIENLLQKFAHQELITIEEPTVGALRVGVACWPQESDADDHESCIHVTSADHTKLVEFDKSYGSSRQIKALLGSSSGELDEGLESAKTSMSLSSSHGDHMTSKHQNQRDSLEAEALGGAANQSSKPTSGSSYSSSSSSSTSSSSATRLASGAGSHQHQHQHHSDHQSGSLDGAHTLVTGSPASGGLALSASGPSLANSWPAKRPSLERPSQDDLESLLSLSSTRERESKKLGEELLELLSKPTAKERNLLEQFRSADGYQVQEFCAKGTKGECVRHNQTVRPCDKLHFKKIIAKHTEESLGDCSFLNTCFHMDSCKYVHYEVDYGADFHHTSASGERGSARDLKLAARLSSGSLASIGGRHAAQSSQHAAASGHSQFKRPLPVTSRSELARSRRSLGGGGGAADSLLLSKQQAGDSNGSSKQQAIMRDQLSSSSCSNLTGAGEELDRLSGGPQTKGANLLEPQTSAETASASSTAAAAAAAAAAALAADEALSTAAALELKNRKRFKTVLYPPQWIQCDLRFFDMSLLGKFSVVMADPPWDIHMELPYGTMSDEEMRKLNIPTLQDEGVIFLWVTGRAMELGRECLALWGYERCDEIIWVKTNQLQRIIRTGRTGHWLNHGKEHCLVGFKGDQGRDMNRGLDCDVIVAEVRATSHKPDEIYGIIERLSPGTRKIELFGRAHNVQPNWITLGNQLNGVRLIEPSLVSAFKKLNLPTQTADKPA